MMCRICQIDDSKLVEAIEESLLNGQGSLFDSDKEKLKEEFPAYAEKIEMITEQDCSMHFNFHQRICRIPRAKTATEEPSTKKNGASLAEDIGKDEAAALYELLNSQAATFNVLNNRIVRQIRDAENEDGSKLLLHPNTTQFYKEIADSIRATVRAIGDLNVALNGQKDGSLEGLLAVAAALNASRKPDSPQGKERTHPQDNPVDGTTTMFDD